MPSVTSVSSALRIRILRRPPASAKRMIRGAGGGGLGGMDWISTAATAHPGCAQAINRQYSSRNRKRAACEITEFKIRHPPRQASHLCTVLPLQASARYADGGPTWGSDVAIPRQRG